MRKYSPRRASSRWLDGDCPKGVLAIFDNPKFGDRFTVFYAEPVAGTSFADTVIGYRGMSETPASAQGIGLYGEMDAYQVAAYRYANSRHACKWSALPPAVRRVVFSDLSDSEV